MFVPVGEYEPVFFTREAFQKENKCSGRARAGCQPAVLQWQLELFSMARSAKVQLVVRDLGYTKLEIDLLLYCMGSGFKMIKICKGTLLAKGPNVQCGRVAVPLLIHLFCGSVRGSEL